MIMIAILLIISIATGIIAGLRISVIRLAMIQTAVAPALITCLLFTKAGVGASLALTALVLVTQQLAWFITVIGENLKEQCIGGEH